MSNLFATRDVIMYCRKYFSGSLLDVGAGNAKYRNSILPCVSKYTTCDMVSGKNIDVVCDVEHLAFPDGTFDTVISTQVLEHVPRPWLMVKEIYRILKKNGVCVLSAPFLVPYHADPHDYFRYTAEGLQSLMKDSGFEVIECSPYGKVGTVLSECMRFNFFSPYDHKLGRFARVIIRIMQKCGRALDIMLPSTRVYANSYIVARKK